MRVLVVHNRYSSRVPSGENLAVDDEIRWLLEAGVEVHRHEVSNDDLDDPGRRRQLQSGSRGRVVAARPPAVPRRCSTRSDRTSCTSTTCFRSSAGACRPPPGDGRSPSSGRCTTGGSAAWAVASSVTGTRATTAGPAGGSRAWSTAATPSHGAASAVVTAGSTLFRLSTRRHQAVTAIAVSDTMARWVVDATGLDPSRVVTKHNGVAGPAVDPPPPAGQRVFLFLGRLSAYKGIDLLLDAWRRAEVDAELRIVGDGDLADDVRAAAATDRRIRMVGQVDRRRHRRTPGRGPRRRGAGGVGRALRPHGGRGDGLRATRDHDRHRRPRRGRRRGVGLDHRSIGRRHGGGDARSRDVRRRGRGTRACRRPPGTPAGSAPRRPPRR